MAVTDRNSFRLYVMRRLGFPAISIDVEGSQVEDRIDDAVQYFTEQHFDGVEEGYYIHTITSTDISNQYFTITDPLVVSVSDLINYDADADNLLSVKFQVRLQDVYDLSRGSVLDYALTQNHIALLDWLFNVNPGVRYSRIEGKIYLDIDWTTEYQPGQIVVFRCMRAVDPTTVNAFWNERQLKDYATALIGLQWAANLGKFSNVALPSGATLNSESIYQKYHALKTKVENELQRGLLQPFYLG